MKLSSRRYCALGTLIFLVTASILRIHMTSIELLKNIVNMTYLLPVSSNLTSSRNVTMLEKITMVKNISTLEIPTMVKNMSENLSAISKMVNVAGVDCVAIFKGSKMEIKAAKKKAKKFGNAISDKSYIQLTADCADFQTNRGYIMSSLTEGEVQFPLAFSMLIYKDVEMVERLLRAIYRPQNVYCTHVDLKSSAEFYKAVSGIDKCFSNVFIVPKRIKVRWGKVSVLKPELLCIEELWKYPKWRYFIKN